MMERTRKFDDQVIYFRRPRSWPENNRWITWGDSVSGTKLRDMVSLGFQPMFEYGVINSKENKERFPPNGNGQEIWGPILTAPDGPSEFPVDQILTLGWHRASQCPVPGVRFPQLEGKKITEYQCPQCRRKPFVDNGDGVAVKSLADHLLIMEKWTYDALMSYGDRIGVDFRTVGATEEIVTEYTAGEEETQPTEYDVERVVAEAPTGFTCACGWVPREDSKNKRSSLETHKRLHCPLREKEVVG
jgi:hypothetical protein